MSSRAGAYWPHIVVIGGGFCGLAAVYELDRHGIRATVLECDAEVGDLADVLTDACRTVAGSTSTIPVSPP